MVLGWSFLENYGWGVVIAVIVGVAVYRTVVKPRISKLKEEKTLEQRKKFDEDVHSRSAARMAEVRERQQRQHDAVSAELKLKEEEARRLKLEQLRKEMEGESVLKNALGSVKSSDSKRTKKETPGEIIDRYIHSKPVVMFSKTNCPFCRKAKSVLATFRLPVSQFEFVELDERDDLPGELIQQEFIKRYGSRSVPKVFIAGECIGGGDDTAALFREGVLDVMIKQAIQQSTK